MLRNVLSLFQMTSSVFFKMFDKSHATSAKPNEAPEKEELIWVVFSQVQNEILAEFTDRYLQKRLVELF